MNNANAIIKNKYLKIWFAVFIMHFLHQVEESIGFFSWYVEYADKLGSWAILGVDIANLAIAQPEYFVSASCAQFLFVSVITYIFRNNNKALKWVVFVYIIGLDCFLIWHIVISYISHSYSPILITCFMGVYLSPKWLYKLFSINEVKILIN